MRLGLRRQPLRSYHVALKLVEGSFCLRQREAQTIERHLNETPTRKVKVIVLQRELVDIGSLLRHGRREFRQIDAVAELPCR